MVTKIPVVSEMVFSARWVQKIWLENRAGTVQCEPRGLPLLHLPLWPLCNIPHCTCRSHSNKGLCLAVVCYYRLNAPCTRMHARARALTCNTVTNTSSYSLYPICTAIFPPRTHCTPPPVPHHHHSIIFMGRPFPLPPPPMCTQLTAHSATPTSLPDNTARHPIIFMHTLHAHSYTAVHSALCWQRCLSNVNVLMHSSHVSACYDYSVHTQTAEAGSPQVQGSNKAEQKVAGHISIS